MKSLTDIANDFGSDKGTVGPSAKHGGHNYTDIYEAYFSHLREAPINVLEIGIGLKRKDDARIAHGRNAEGGGSIKMWRDYFTRAQIYAIDIVEAISLDSDRVHTAVVDQGDRASLEAYLQKIGDTTFDFIIDDGSHKPAHQQISFEVLFPRLKSGGTYFVEDLQENGLGDAIKGTRMTDGVLNTRAVFRSFVETGVCATPNAFLDPASLVRDIAGVTFSVPLRKINRMAALTRFFGSHNAVLDYQPGTELLCAIRKS